LQGTPCNALPATNWYKKNLANTKVSARQLYD